MIYIQFRHTYGSGHLHGLSAPGLHLDIALEPDALHRETQRRLTTGDQRQPLIIERGYTATGQIEQLTLQSPNSANEQAYQYNVLGRMLFRSQHAQGQGAQGHASSTIAYNYDAAGRLIGSQHGHDAHADYRYDALGRRINKTVHHPNGTTAATHYG